MSRVFTKKKAPKVAKAALLVAAVAGAFQMLRWPPRQPRPRPGCDR
ncbi:hypothetical protein MJ584_00440 [Klebsiella pneumoniae]|nr:hypothetical protein MJ584_00440 [Klebsiella pneumoniae]